MRIRAHILLKNRDRRSIFVDPTKETFSFRQGLYVLSSEFIRNGPQGPELFYFENNPTPLNLGKLDKSSTYFDAVLLENFITQVHGETSGGGLNLFGWLRPLLDNPQYMVGIVLALVVLWAVIAGGFKV